MRKLQHLDNALDLQTIVELGRWTCNSAISGENRSNVVVLGPFSPLKYWTTHSFDSIFGEGLERMLASRAKQAEFSPTPQSSNIFTQCVLPHGSTYYSSAGS